MHSGVCCRGRGPSFDKVYSHIHFGLESLVSKNRENVHLNTHVSDLGIGYRGPSIASAFQRQSNISLKLCQIDIHLLLICYIYFIFLQFHVKQDMTSPRTYPNALNQISLPVEVLLKTGDDVDRVLTIS